MKWFCVITNAMCLLPAYVTYKKKLLGETVCTLSTGISSVLYHGTKLYNWPIHEVGIRNSDIMLSYLLVCHTAHCIVNFNRRWDYTISVLPIVIFGSDLDVLYKLTCVACYAVACLLYIAVTDKPRNSKMYALGAVFAINDIVFFTLGNEYYYTILHGMHHICVFAAQACFFHGIRVPTTNEIWPVTQ